MHSVAAAALPHTQTPAAASGSRASVYAGRALSVLAILFLTFDAVGKIFLVQPVLEGSAELGFSSRVVFAIGLVLLASVVVYAVPRTAVLGAVLLTGFLGGAIATHARLEAPLFSHTLFPVYVALFVWGGLFLRDARVRAFLLPLRRGA